MVSDKPVPAVIKAIKAKNTFAYFYITSRLTAAFAGLFAQFTIDTFALFFADSPDSESSNDGEQCTERTNKSAIESGNDKIEQDSCEEYRQHKPYTLIEAGCCRGEAKSPVGKRDQ